MKLLTGLLLITIILAQATSGCPGKHIIRDSKTKRVRVSLSLFESEMQTFISRVYNARQLSRKFEWILMIKNLIIQNISRINLQISNYSGECLGNVQQPRRSQQSHRRANTTARDWGVGQTQLSGQTSQTDRGDGGLGVSTEQETLRHTGRPGPAPHCRRSPWPLSSRREAKGTTVDNVYNVM